MFGIKNMVSTEIDIPSPLMDFLLAHEVHCVAACCGEDAFEFSPKAISENQYIEKAVAKLDLGLARKQLEEFRKSTQNCSNIPSNDRINICWQDDDAVDIWCDMIRRLIDFCETYLKSKAKEVGIGQPANHHPS